MPAIEEIPLEELRTDLAETIADIALCERALLLEIYEYRSGDGKALTQKRLDTNRKIKEMIEAEIARRAALAAPPQQYHCCICGKPINIPAGAVCVDDYVHTDQGSGGDCHEACCPVCHPGKGLK